MLNIIRRKTPLLGMLPAVWYAKDRSGRQLISGQLLDGITNQIYAKTTRKLAFVALEVSKVIAN